MSKGNAAGWLLALRLLQVNAISHLRGSSGSPWHWRSGAAQLGAAATNGVGSPRCGLQAGGSGSAIGGELTVQAGGRAGRQAAGSPSFRGS